ncbi:hypothetical protein BC629DRAFT_1537581 [Irpex lacteus]|nr:hypothetical protein BC629DRAFT_1537581 [Irpex lacteus]
MQRFMKIIIRRCQQEDIVEETVNQLREGKPPEAIKLDDTIGTLRRRSVRWMVLAYQGINDPELVKKVSDHVGSNTTKPLLMLLYRKAFMMCRLQDREFNLSQESLSSSKAKNLIREVRLNEPDLWAELNKGLDCVVPDWLKDSEDEPLDAPKEFDDIDEDHVDISVPLDTIRDLIFDHSTQIPEGFVMGDAGCISSSMDEDCVGDVLPVPDGGAGSSFAEE